MLNSRRQHGTGRKHPRTSTKLRRWLGTIPFQLENRDVPAGLFLQGQSYIDVNENGKLDLGEPYLPGAVVELRSQDGSALIASTTTDATGAYRFDDAHVPGGLLPGTYRLVETPPAGYLNTPTPNQAAVSASWPLGTATQLNPATIQVTLSDWNNPNNPPLALSFLSTGDVASLQMTLTTPTPILPNNNGAFTYDFAGELNLRLTGDDLANPVDFLTYCLDLTRLLPNSPATGQVIPRGEPVPPGLTANAGRIAYLYNEYGAAGFLNGAASALFAGQGIADSGVLPPAAEDAAAFQLALWELCYDVGTPAQPEGDLEAGNFFFRAVAGQPDFSTDPASVAVRQKAYAFLRDSLGKSEQAIFLDGSVSNTQLTIISGSLNFGNVRGASIAGVKFNDVNGDGTREAGESGLQGWTIQLLSTTDVVLATTTTAADGSYTFDGLAAGTYRVREVGQAGWIQTTVNPGDVAVVSGTDVTGVDFGNFRLGRLAGVKFNDINGDGVRQAGESGLAGWTIELDRGADGTVDATTTTDATGNYAFDGLVAGTYRVREVGQTGWVQTTVNPGDVTVLSGTDVTGVDFGNFRLGRLAGVKFNDINGDGVREAGESGLQGWTIQLLSTADVVLATTTTDAAGNYAFDGLMAGTYRVREVGQAGWVQTTVNPGDVAVVSGTVATGLDFGNTPLESGGGGGGRAPELPLVRPIVLAPEVIAPITQVSKRDLLASTLEVRTAGEKAVPARQTTADFNRDGIPDTVVATGPGVPSFVRVFDGATGAVLAQFSPFESSFTGGLLVTTGDLTGDGVPDLVVAADQGGGPRVQVYSGAGFGLAFDVLALADPNFRGGVRPAVGDVNGDGVQDLVVAAGFGGGPRVTVWNGAALRAGAPAPLADFFAFEPTLRNGAFVAAGDVDGDGASDLILGGGPGGGPRVRVVSGRDLIAAGPFSTLDQIAGTAQIADFFAGDPASRDGARVAFWDTNGDGHGEVVTGSGPGGTADVRSYTTADLLADPGNPTAPQDLDALFGTSQFSAVFVG